MGAARRSIVVVQQMPVSFTFLAALQCKRMELVKMCGPQHVDKNGIHNIPTDAKVLVFVICPYIVVALFVGGVLVC